MNYSITADIPILRPAEKAPDSRRSTASDEIQATAKPVRRSRRYRLAVTLVSLLLIAMVTLFALDRMLSPNEFHIKQVQVHGAGQQVDPVIAEQRIWQSLQGNYFGLDLEQLETAVEQMPWVHSATLRRRWPDTLLVEMDEVQPVAKWGEDRWLNVTGDLVELPDAPLLATLPSLVGPSGEEALLWSRFREWQGLMAANGAQLRTLRLDDRGTWTLQFSLSPLAAAAAATEEKRPGVTAESNESTAPAVGELTSEQAVVGQEVRIMARDEDVDPQLARFVKALKFTFLDQLEQLDYVDLRYPNGFAIRWREPVGDAPEKKN